MSESEGNLTTADAEIDLYADVVENELETDTGDTYNPHALQDPDLYDDVITTQPSTGDFTDITNTVNQTHVKHDPSHENTRQTSTPNNVYNGRRFSMYVGQLTWWTTDADLAEAIQEIGVKDLLEVKFHENRVNGQSKGFAVVTVGSDASYRTMQEKLPKREIHGQNAIVLPCTKQSLNQLEPPTRKEGPMESMAPPMGVPPLRPMMRPPLGLPLPMPRGGPMDHPYRYPHQAPVLLPGGPPGMARGAMPMSLAPRPGGPMVLGRMPGPHAPPGVHPQQSVLVMQRAGVPPAPNPPGMVRPGGVPVSSNSMSVMSAVHPQGYYPAQPGQPVPAPHALSLPGQTHVDPYYRGVDIRHDPSANLAQITDAEFQEIMEKNKTVSTSAINRAVEDASNGDFATAIETLVTAISLIKQSKIANDDRCKILIGSLQDTLKGIEDKSYGQRARHRSRSGSPRESSRKKHRHRSRSPRDRNEYRRNEDYDSKYNREHRRR